MKFKYVFFFLALILFQIQYVIAQSDYSIEVINQWSYSDIDKTMPFLEFQIQGNDVWDAANIGFDIKRIDPDGNSSFKKITERTWVPLNYENFQDLGSNQFLLKKTDLKYGEDDLIEITIIYPEDKFLYLCDTEGEVELTLPKGMRKLAELRNDGLDVEAYSGDKMIIKRNGQYYLAYAILYHSNVIDVRFKNKNRKTPETSGSNGSGFIRANQLCIPVKKKKKRKLPGSGASGSTSSSEKCSGPLDSDGDGVPDNSDVFPNDPSECGDTDSDGIGDNRDKDDDNDGTPDIIDFKPHDSSEQKDSDGDNVGDNADKFPFDRSESSDMDNDGIGNNSDTDNDNDGVSDDLDEFPYDYSEQYDTDADRIGDNADTDDDNDGVLDGDDPAPKDPNIPNRYQPQSPNQDAVIIDDSETNTEQNSNHGVSW